MHNSYTPARYIPCDLCGQTDPRFVLDCRTLDGPLVQCVSCGLHYVGLRRSVLHFGKEGAGETTARVKLANTRFRHLRLEEERRLALLNAKWRLELIRDFKPSGKLLEIGCARGDFLEVAGEWFETSGVEPNPDLAESAALKARVHQDVIERTPWTGFDVIASFHVIEHTDSPSRFIAAAAERLKVGGLLVVETPNIHSIPFKILKSKWRQFIPEHYFFFDPHTIEKLLSRHGLKIRRTLNIGKYASTELISNRLSRYAPWLPRMYGLGRLTFRMNPRDIMLVFATRQQ